MGRGLAAPAPGEADEQEPQSSFTLSHPWPDAGRGGSEGAREPGESKGEVKTRGKKRMQWLQQHTRATRLLPHKICILNNSCLLIGTQNSPSKGRTKSKIGALAGLQSNGLHWLNAPPGCCSKRQERNQWFCRTSQHPAVGERCLPERRGEKKPSQANKNNPLLCFKKPLLTSPEKSQHS